MRVKTIFIAMIALLVLPPVAQAQGVMGLWKTQLIRGNQGFVIGQLVVKVAPCGDKVCGTILHGLDDNGKKKLKYPHIGRLMFWDMVPDGKGKFKNGTIWDPRSGKTYASRLKLRGSKLKVKACLKSGLCNTLGWHRVK